MFHTLLILLFAANTNPSAAEPDAKAEPPIVLQVRELMKENKADEAMKLCNDVLRESPDDGHALLIRGKLFFSQFGDYKHALADLDRAVELLPGDYEPLMYRAYPRTELGMLDEALADLSAAEAIEPDEYLIHAYQGNVYLKKRNGQVARERLSQAINLKPELALAYVGRGQAEFLLGNTDAALRDFAAAIEIDPKSYNVRLWHARILTLKHQLKAAMKDLDDAIADGERNKDIFQLRGEIRLLERDVQAAITEFRQAVVFPDADYRCHLRLGHCANSLDEHAEAVTALTRALELRPNDIDALKLRASSYLYLDDSAKGLEDIHAAAEQGQPDAQTLIIRASLLVNSQQYEDALADAERAIKLTHPNDVDALNVKASALAGLERYEESLEVLNAVLKIDESNTYARDLRAQVNKYLAMK